MKLITRNISYVTMGSNDAEFPSTSLTELDQRIRWTIGHNTQYRHTSTYDTHHWLDCFTTRDCVKFGARKIVEQQLRMSKRFAASNKETDP